MRQVQIYINDQIIDLFDDENIEVSSSVQNINDIAKVFTDFSQQFTVPASPKNNQIFRHYYQNDVEDGFIAKTRQPARIEINYTPFRTGKIQLEGTELKDGQIESYTITFYGEVVTLKDLFQDDKLRDLDYSSIEFEGTYTEVKYTITSGADLDVRFPLISSERVWTYGSGTENIANSGTAIEFGELFPALRTKKVLELIENKYGINFTGSFIDYDTRFKNLFTWWKNSDVFTAGKAPVLLEWPVYTAVTPNPINAEVDYDPLADNKVRFKYIDVMQWTPYNDGTWTFNYSYFSSTLLVQAANPASQFVIDVYKNGTYEYSTSVITGDVYLEWAVEYQNLTGMDDYYEFYFRSNDSDTFEVSVGWVFEYSVTDSSNQTFVLDRIANSSNYSFVQSDFIDFNFTAPDITISDYFSGLLRMFNLTCYPTATDTFQVEPLERWYAYGETIDITQYTDISTIKVDRPKLYTNIEFNWLESKSLLNVKYKENNNKQYGGLTSYFGYDGGDFIISLPFETLLFSKFTGTDLQEGNSLETDPDYKPVIPNCTMLYFYPESKTTSFYLSDGVTPEEITNYYPFGQDTFYNVSDYSINFNEEISSLSLEPNENSLYNIYYRAYLQNLFSDKARIVTVDTNLPLSLLNSIELNDALIIRDKKYRINLMKSQLTTGKVTLELITDLVVTPRRKVPPVFPTVPEGGGVISVPVAPIKPSKGDVWNVVPAAPYPWISTDPVDVTDENGDIIIDFIIATNVSGVKREAEYTIQYKNSNGDIIEEEKFVIKQDGVDGYLLQEDNSLLLQENIQKIKL